MKYQQNGIGLTEVLIAMMLLGVGVIGFAGLQVRAIGATNEASFRMQAMSIARDVSERLLLNNSALSTYKPATPVTWSAIPASNLTLCNGATVTACTPVNMANYDMANIAAIAAATLPNGQVSVRTCEGRTNNCIYVSWNTTTPTVGAEAPNCVQPTTGLYTVVVAPLSTDCVISET
jgi:type IV pilus assembly protein PilV